MSTFRFTSQLCLALAAGLSLSACVETASAPAPAVPEAIIAADQDLCLNAVASQTKNSVRLRDTKAEPGQTTVFLGVGPRNALWRCIVIDGHVADVRSFANEGYL